MSVTRRTANPRANRADSSAASRVIAEEHYGRLPGQDREPGAGRGQLVTPDRDQDDVVVPARVRHHLASASTRPPPSTSWAHRPPAATSSVLRPWLSTETWFPAAARWAPYTVPITPRPR